jgi:16S rRNA (adenine1518-N6/adenine1519-N6)-dimethyltransferase
VATPVISNLLIAGVELERMIVTVQWEIAEKMIAQPSTKEYGALAVLVQSLADTEVLRKLPPSVFWPRPQIDSGIVKITPNAEKRRRIPDVQRFRNFLRDVYSHRRKNLRGAIIAMTGHQHQKAVVDAQLAELGYAGTERAETLSIEQHLQLCEAFGQQKTD